MSVFAREEYRRRIAATRERMAAEGIDVLLASHPANMNYLSGYDGWSYYVHQLVALSLDDEDPVWIGREMDTAGARLTVFMGESRIHSYPDEYVDARDRHCMQRVAGILGSLGWHRGRIGVEMDAWYFTARAYVELGACLPEARLVDAWPLVNWVRLVKSPPEIEMMRAAGRIVSRAMGVAVEAIAPGVRECDAVAEITRALLQGTPEHWGDYPATLPHAGSGARAAAPHLTWTGAPFEAGAATNIELGGCHHRYHAALARTLCLGRAPPRLHALAEVTREGLHAALDAARPGAACEEVEAAWRRVIAPRRLREALAHRLLHRTQLPSGLGRAERVASRRRHHGARAGHVLPPDARHVDGRMGLRAERDLPGRRGRAGGADRLLRRQLLIKS